MKFTLAAPERSHGIRVIGSIPDLPLCRVEGQNGVGKTLALHLLELCTGQQPYRTRPDAWRTLCQFLGPATVTIEGLAGTDRLRNGSGHTLRFAFDWTDRADELPVTVTRDMFGEVTLDGEMVPEMDEVRRWLTVVRIAGNETLTETIAGLVAQDVTLLRAAMGVADARQLHADRVLGGMLEEFPAEPARRLLATVDELSALGRKRAEFELDRNQTKSLVERLELAAMAQAAVSDVNASAETLDAEIDALRGQLANARERRESVGAALAEARERERTSAELEKQLASAQRTFSRRLGALKRAEEAVERAAAALRIAADRTVIEEARQQLESDRDRLAADRADLADVFALRDLIDGVVHALAPAATGGLRARVIAEVDGRPVTAGELLDAARRRRERLTADAPAVDDLDRGLAELQARESALRELADLLVDRVDKHQKLGDAEKTLEEFGERGGTAGTTVADNAAALASAQRVEIEVASALGTAERQRAQLGGGLSLEDLRTERDRRLREAGTTTEQLDNDLRTSRARLVALDDQLDAATARRDALTAERVDLGREVEDQTRRLHAEVRHKRLLGVLGSRASVVGHGTDDLARAWIAVHDAEERAVTRLAAARGSIGDLTRSLDDLVDMIRSRRQPSPDLDRVRRIYQERMLTEFSRGELVEALFDDGQLTRVDLAAREVRWRTVAGEARVRPFEAFSSGERAFAYVQARLAAIGRLTAHNRVVAVDEFGAFLSRDRLVRLQQAVKAQLTEGVVDQVLVVLPFRGDVAERAATASPTSDGDEAGYVTGPFDPGAEA